MNGIDNAQRVINQLTHRNLFTRRRGMYHGSWLNDNQADIANSQPDLFDI